MCKMGYTELRFNIYIYIYINYICCEFQICNEYQDYSLMLQMYQIDVLDFNKTGLNNKSNK